MKDCSVAGISMTAGKSNSIWLFTVLPQHCLSYWVIQLLQPGVLLMVIFFCRYEPMLYKKRKRGSNTMGFTKEAVCSLVQSVNWQDPIVSSEFSKIRPQHSYTSQVSILPSPVYNIHFTLITSSCPHLPQSQSWSLKAPDPWLFNQLQKSIDTAYTLWHYIVPSTRHRAKLLAFLYVSLESH